MRDNQEKQIGEFLLRLAALLTSLIPGCIIWGFGIWFYFFECKQESGHGHEWANGLSLIFTAAIVLVGSIPLVIAVVGWRVPRVAGLIFLILALIVFCLGFGDMLGGEGYSLYFSLLFLVGGLLNLTVWWLRRNNQQVQSA